MTGTSGGVTRSATLSLSIGLFSDDFETNRGWMVNPLGTDTATTGMWERGDPEATTKQLGTAPSGLNSLVTGRLAGSSAGAHDIDGGVTSIRSPAIALPTGSLALSFQYNFAHGSNSGTDDYLRVKVDGTVVFQKLGAATNINGAWQSASVDLSAYAGRTVQLAVEAADVGTASLLEAQIDDVRVTRGAALSDDFETNKGWTVNPLGTDTATTGRFERGDPEATTKQLGTTPSGLNCLVTGRLAGSSAGAHDIDSGVTSIRSPAIALPAGAPTLSFSYSVAHGNNSSADDYLRVKVDGVTVFEGLGAATDVTPAWQTASVNLSAYAGRTVNITIEAADVAVASLFEAQVDDVRIT